MVRRSHIVSSRGKLRKKRIERKAKTFLAGVLVIATVITEAAMVTHSGWFVIKDINIQGTQAINEQDVATIAHDKISGDYLSIFSKQNIFLYPKSALSAELYHVFPRIAQVDVKADYFHAVTIGVTERGPAALWCGTQYGLQSVDTTPPCYFLDDTGFVYAKAPSFGGGVYLELYGPLVAMDDHATTTPITKHFLTQGVFDQLLSFARDLGDEGMTPRALVVLSSGDYSFKLTGGGEVLFNLRMDTANLTKDIIAAIEAKKKGNPDVFSNLEYIDARFADANKIYFKFTN